MLENIPCFDTLGGKFPSGTRRDFFFRQVFGVRQEIPFILQGLLKDINTCDKEGLKWSATCMY